MLYSIYIPNNTNIIILKKRGIHMVYLYNKKSFLFKIKEEFYLNKYLNIISIFIKLSHNTKEHLIILDKINNFLFTWNFFFFKKITFKGKGYKILKKKKNLFLFFNFAHINIYINTNALIKRLTKTKLLFFYKNTFKYNRDLKKFIKIRLLNKFTKRGLRLSRYMVTKRKLKIKNP